MQIVGENLTYVYSAKSSFSVRALNNVSITINEGEFFGIAGHTGSGKSTFVQHLNGLIKLEKGRGSLMIGGFDLSDSKCNMKELRSKVGMIFQYPEYQLFAETVQADVAFGLKNFFSLTETEINDRVKTALETVGLDYYEVKDKSPFDLSGGQKRRVAIAGVIVTRPEILVLDEPVAGLDPQGKEDFLKLLHRIHGSFVKTVVIISHDMNLIAENCTRAAIFSKGEIIALDAPKNLFKQGEQLRQTGLDLPVTAFLTERLKTVGANIENDFTAQDFAVKFAAYVNNGSKNGTRRDV